MIKSPEFFRDEFLPTLNQVTSFSATARVLNFDASTVHAWIKESKAAQKRGDDPSEFLFEYDGSTRYLHQHIKAVGRASITDIEANARARARDGYFRPCRFQGRTVWREDAKLVGLDEATLEMLGYKDRLLRVNGELQPELEWIPPSTDLVIAVLQANSETYRKRSSVDVNMNARVTGGVAILGGPKQQPQIAAPLPVLEVIADEIEEASLDVTDTAPDQPTEAADDDEDEEAAPADPGPRISEPTPPEYRAPANPLIDPARADALRASLLRSLPTDNAAARAALKGRTA
jgi:hypothetical protein